MRLTIRRDVRTGKSLCGHEPQQLASVYREEGRYAEAEPFFQRAVAIREKLLASENPQMGGSSQQLGNLMSQKESIQRPSLSLSAQWRSRKVARSHASRISPQAWNCLAVLYFLEGNTQSRAALPACSGRFVKRLRARHPFCGRKVSTI